MTRPDSTAREASVSPGRIGIIAGGGSLPVSVCASLLARGERPFVIVIEGEGASASDFRGAEVRVVEAEELARVLPRIARAGVDRLVLAGSVARRPSLRRLKWSAALLRFLPRAIVAFAQGDDALLRALMAHVEGYGIRIVGAQEIVPDLLAPRGVLTAVGPTAADRRDIEAASRAALAIGALDIGQAAIAVGGRVVALEGIEGTDGLLERMVGLRHHGRLAGRRGGVLVKRCKPSQDLRADLPTIGPRTVEAALAAGLAGIAVDAGRSFILEFRRTIDLADTSGLFVLGLHDGETDR